MTGDSSGENPWWLIWGIHGGESGGRRQLGEGVRRKKRGLLAAEWVSVLSSSVLTSLEPDRSKHTTIILARSSRNFFGAAAKLLARSLEASREPKLFF